MGKSEMSMLSERSQTVMAKYCVTPLYDIPEKTKL